jgi:hypothetical protein
MVEICEIGLSFSVARLLLAYFSEFSEQIIRKWSGFVDEGFLRRQCGDIGNQNTTNNRGGRMANHNDQMEDAKFEITSKRRKGFPSETRVKRGDRVVHGTKDLFEKLGRNDLCPCRSGRSF